MISKKKVVNEYFFYECVHTEKCVCGYWLLDMSSTMSIVQQYENTFFSRWFAYLCNTVLAIWPLSHSEKLVGTFLNAGT